ncbi:hypothetical protein SUGI_0212210 [Cryptomeria japonica]|nr:hypothetical protein SUGI_0212210 [Cryptomeria japonica]
MKNHMTSSKGFSFKEVGNLLPSTNKVVCCHFSPDGKWLASAGHDKKVVLWNVETMKLKSAFTEHNHFITDGHLSPRFAKQPEDYGSPISFYCVLWL